MASEAKRVKGRSKYHKKGHAHQPSDPQSLPTEETPIDVNSSPILFAFSRYQKELDLRNDRYERVVKLSRDITIESKRTIFCLHRIKGENKEATLKESEDKLLAIAENLWSKVALELKGQDPYQYLRAYSPGLQEYIEAVSFHQYLRDGSLINLETLQKRLEFNADLEKKTDFSAEGSGEIEGQTPAGDSAISVDSSQNSGLTRLKVEIPPMEYLLGLADLTGEVMRLTINNAAAGQLDKLAVHCELMRSMHDGFIMLGNSSRELPKKMFTLKQSLQKVENACYTLKVRGSEIPKHMLTDVLTNLNLGKRAFDVDDGISID